MTVLSRDGLFTVKVDRLAKKNSGPRSPAAGGAFVTRLADRPLIPQEPGFRILFPAFAFFGVMSFNMALANTNK